MVFVSENLLRSRFVVLQDARKGLSSSLWTDSDQVHIHIIMICLHLLFFFYFFFVGITPLPPPINSHGNVYKFSFV